MDMKTRDEQIREALELGLDRCEDKKDKNVIRKALALLDQPWPVADGLECGWCGKSLDKDEIACPECGKHGYVQALEKTAQPVVDGARELAEQLLAVNGFGIVHKTDVAEAATLITQALREELEKAAERICEVARPFCTTAEISMLKNAAIMGEEGK